MNNPGYIVIEGPIGVGKTTLARRLAQEFGTDLLLEGADENPFLGRFYRDPRGAALPTQLFFLLQRVRQINELRQGDMFRPVRVADFLMEKDQLFARLNLDDDELQLYGQVYQRFAIDAPQPDLVIYLQAPVEVLVERIRKRGIEHEQVIERDYLARLCDAYTQLFYHYDAAPLLIVNAAEIDLVNNDQDYNLLLKHVRSVRSGRHYLNPEPIGL